MGSLKCVCVGGAYASQGRSMWGACQRGAAESHPEGPGRGVSAPHQLSPPHPIPPSSPLPRASAPHRVCYPSDTSRHPKAGAHPSPAPTAGWAVWHHGVLGGDHLAPDFMRVPWGLGPVRSRRGAGLQSHHPADPRGHTLRSSSTLHILQERRQCFLVFPVKNFKYK